jgi:hypothetical protein
MRDICMVREGLDRGQALSLIECRLIGFGTDMDDFAAKV